MPQAEEIKQLQNLIAYFNSKIKDIHQLFINSESAIQSLLVSGNLECKATAKRIRDKGFNVKAILSPTVPIGKERIRICLHAYNTKEEIDNLINIITQ